MRIGQGFTLILYFVLDFFYSGVFETLWNGQTPGKRVMHLRVLTIDGQPINASQAVLRNLFRLADAMPISFYLVGLISAAANRRYQRLGDLVCGTMVVVEHPSWLAGVTRIDESLAIQLAEHLPKNFEVSRDLGKALSAYVERRRYFSRGRRADIARYVGAPLAARFGLPPDTSHDLLLCAIYHQTFFADEQQDDGQQNDVRHVNPRQTPVEIPGFAMASTETVSIETDFPERNLHPDVSKKSP